MFHRALFHFLTLSLLLCLTACDRNKDAAYTPTPAEPGESAVFPFSHDPDRLAQIGPQACAACHAEEVAEWKTSHHAKANRPVSLEKDGPAFTPARRIEESGVTYLLSIENTTELTLSILKEGSEPLKYELVGVIGETPIRQYLAVLPGQKFQTISASYDVKNDRWVDVLSLIHI